MLQSLLGFLAIHSPNLFGGPAKARQVYKYHRLSGYVLVTLLLLTAHLGGAHSTWALGLKRENMKSTRVAAFWVGAPVLLLATLVRMRYVCLYCHRHWYELPGEDKEGGWRVELIDRPSKMQFGKVTGRT
jgi:hypothetical protein